MRRGGGVCVILFKNRGYWLTFSYPGRHRCSTQLFTWKVTEIVVSRTENEGFSPTHGRPVSCLKCMRMLDCRFQTNHNTVQALSPVIQSWKKCCRSEVSEAIWPSDRAFWWSVRERRGNKGDIRRYKVCEAFTSNSCESKRVCFD